MPYATSRLTDFMVKKIKILLSQYKHPVARIAFFFGIFLVAYSFRLERTMHSVYQAMAALSYRTHSLYATVNVVRGVVAAVAQLMFARLSDTFGRLQLLVVLIILYVVGTVIISQAYDIQRFAGGTVLYQCGYTGMYIITQILVLDNSVLNWRLVCSYVPALPFIINTWVSGDITSAVGTRWLWGIGMWAFIMPLACVPLLAMMVHIEWMARRTPQWKQLISSRDTQEDEETELAQQKVSWKEYFVDLFHKLDVVGLFLVAAVLALILVPLTTAGGVKTQWGTAKIIVPLVIGVCMIPVFVLWESKFAVNPLLPGHLLRERGVWLAIGIAVFINWVWYMPNDYMYTVLVVAVNELVKLATRIVNLYTFVSVITGSILGLFVVKFRRLKPFIIFGICMWFVANGLLIKFRSGDDARLGIITGLVLLGFGAGFFIYATQALIQSCTSHKHMAVATAAYLSLYNVGSALGASISGAVWTQTLYKRLLQYMGDEALATRAYGSPFEFIVDYPWGTPVRNEMVQAYREVQKALCVIGICLVAPMLLLLFFLRDHQLALTQELKDIEEKEAKDRYKGLFNVLFKRKRQSESAGVAEMETEVDAMRQVDTKANVESKIESVDVKSDSVDVKTDSFDDKVKEATIKERSVITVDQMYK